MLAKRAGRAAWKENRKQADAAYQEAIQIDSSDAKAYRGLGFIYENEQKNHQAIADFEKYLQLAPQAWDRVKIEHDLAEMQSSAGSH